MGHPYWSEMCDTGNDRRVRSYLFIYIFFVCKEKFLLVEIYTLYHQNKQHEKQQPSEFNMVGRHGVHLDTPAQLYV